MSPSLLFLEAVNIIKNAAPHITLFLSTSITLLESRLGRPNRLWREVAPVEGGIEEIQRLGQVIDLPTEFGGHRREGRGRRTIFPMLNCADRLES